MNLNKVTIEDCVEEYYKKRKAVILNDGKVLGFQQKEIPTQTANQSGDK